MREYKYRAIDKKTGDFVYGFLSYADFAFIIVEPIDIPPTMGEPGGDHITLWHQIKSETIGQLTGLKDKKRDPIYEGDILCFTGLAEYHRKPFVMEWDNSRGRYSDYSPRQEAEIIGNIYENPELLK